MTELNERIAELCQRRPHVKIAIDGPCTAGKTTLAALLAEQFDCNVFHMDDFFLRSEQRTAQRLAEVGGNVDYVRFREEVLLPLEKGDAFSYRPCDCRTCQLARPIAVEPKAVSVIEGSYSHHPYFGDCYDLKVFLTIAPDLQRARVLARPEALHQRFFTEWIPMENDYFAYFQVPENSHLVI